MGKASRALKRKEDKKARKTALSKTARRLKAAANGAGRSLSDSLRALYNIPGM